jgi:hypothetical protein
MKAFIYLFSFVLLTAMTFNNNVSPTDPIPGVEVKLGRKLSSGGQIIATGLTDNNGTVEFKNLAEGKGYYVDFGIKEKGIKSAIKTHTVVIGFACTSGKMANPSTMTEKWENSETAVTVLGNTIRFRITEADLRSQR